MARKKTAPERVSLSHPKSGRQVSVTLARADVLRTRGYTDLVTLPGARKAPRSPGPNRPATGDDTEG